MLIIACDTFCNKWLLWADKLENKSCLFSSWGEERRGKEGRIRGIWWWHGLWSFWLISFIPACNKEHVLVLVSLRWMFVEGGQVTYSSWNCHECSPGALQLPLSVFWCFTRKVKALKGTHNLLTEQGMNSQWAAVWWQPGAAGWGCSAASEAGLLLQPLVLWPLWLQQQCSSCGTCAGAAVAQQGQGLFTVGKRLQCSGEGLRLWKVQNVFTWPKNWCGRWCHTALERSHFKAWIS